MSDVWLAALALMLVIEGILPFTAPRIWRQTFQQLVTLSDGQLRFAGLMSMVIGLAVLYFVT
jgi:uncharacterized protein YjeT (DUF2065 family)